MGSHRKRRRMNFWHAKTEIQKNNPGGCGDICAAAGMRKLENMPGV